MEISRSVGQHGGSTSRLSGSQGRCQPTRSVSSVGILSVNSGIVQLASSVCVLWASVAICALQGWIGICLLIAIVATALNLLLFRQTIGYWNSLIILFWFSHAAYGISGPLSWYLSETSIPFHREINYAEFYIMFYALASMGFTLGCLLVLLKRTCFVAKTPVYPQVPAHAPIWLNSCMPLLGLPAGCGTPLRNRAKRTRHHATQGAVALNPRALLWGSIMLGIVGAVFELYQLRQLDFQKVLELGKGYYHLSFSQHNLMDFSSSFVLASAALLGFFFATPSLSKSDYFKAFGSWVLVNAPTLLKNLIVGERGIFVFVIFCIIFSAFMFNKITVLRYRTLLIVLFLYIFSVVLFASRGLSGKLILGLTDWNTFYGIVRESFLNYSNPAVMEFGAVFVNFNVFYASAEELPFRFGETYIRGIVSTFHLLFHGDRMPTIVEEFNYMFFPESMERGIGLAFSSIIEAYWNFGTFGVFAVYFVVGLVLSILEQVAYHSRFFLVHLVYVMFIPVVLRFHRTHFGLTAWLFPIVFACLTYTCYNILSLLRARKWKWFE